MTVENYLETPIEQWFSQEYGTRTPIQELSLPVIAQGKNVLLIAPTGSGKTLSAFLWAINQLVSGAWGPGTTRVLYISPLKALNNDIRRNLLQPLAKIRKVFTEESLPFPEINVVTRSGDTPQSDRRRMVKHPPEIFITTPESLNIILNSRKSREMFSGIRTVILDEVHVLAGGKRGSYLISGIERLTLLCGEFQRIAISATVRPPETIARFIAGYQFHIPPGGMDEESDADCSYEAREITVIHAPTNKEYLFSIRFPEKDFSDETETDDSRWTAIIPELKQIVKENRSTLIFTNTRRHAEKITLLLNEGEEEELAYSHHGSLSKEIRHIVETRLKRGELRAIVATSSLELGIDIGTLDEVILIQTPPSVASGLQRIGRAGHNVGEKSKGILFPLHAMDIVDGAVLTKEMAGSDIESIAPPENPLDILAQIILGMTSVDSWDIDRLYAFIRTIYPFHHLSRRQYDLVLEMLKGRYADSRIRELQPRINTDLLENTVTARSNVLPLLYHSGGTIPNRGYYTLRRETTKEKIGELDEEFVWERKVGESFPFGAMNWRITSIDSQHVEVIPSTSSNTTIPFWRAERQNRDFRYSEKKAEFLLECDKRSSSDVFFNLLLRDYFLEPTAAEKMISFLELQKEITGAPLPNRQRIIVEEIHDSPGDREVRKVILHTLWGGKVNLPFAFAFSGAWEKKYGYPLQSFADNDCVLFLLPHQFDGTAFREMVSNTMLLRPETIETNLRYKLEASGFFGARFRENAGRALLLPRGGFNKRFPLWLNRLRSKKLLEAVKRYEDFPLLTETWRSCLRDEFDLENLALVLSEIEQGEIDFVVCATALPSPFAQNMVWRHTNIVMYQDDTPIPSKTSRLSDDILKEAVYSKHLRPQIECRIVEDFETKLQRTAVGYAPSREADCIDWINERVIIPSDEWQRLLAAIAVETGNENGVQQLQSLREAALGVLLPGAKKQGVVTIESLTRLIKALAVNQEEIGLYPLLPETLRIPESGQTAEIGHHDIIQQFREKLEKMLLLLQTEETADTIIAEYLRFCGPVPPSSLSCLFGFTQNETLSILNNLADTDTVVIDTLIKSEKDNGESEVCDAENLELLLRLSRKKARPTTKPLCSPYLQLFWAKWQNLDYRGTAREDFQEVLERLFGYPLQPTLWEQEVFPARLSHYFPQWLDSLLAAEKMIWCGTSEKKIFFCFPEDIGLYIEKDASACTMLPKVPGKFSFLDIIENSTQHSAKTTERLWREVWQSAITCDSFEPVRKGAEMNFKPPADAQTRPEEQRFETGRGRFVRSRPLQYSSGLNRWKTSRPIEGNWFLTPTVFQAEDALAELEEDKERVRRLIHRYGIIFKEVTEREFPSLRWSSLFKAVRLMELSGELVCGQFFEGIRGMQAASPSALRLFRSLSEETGKDTVYWINACDPVSSCSLKIEGLSEHLPPRVPSNHIVFHGVRTVLVSKQFGRTVILLSRPGNSHLQDYFGLFTWMLSRERKPLLRIRIEEINGTPARESPFRDDLVQFGFKYDYKGLVLRRS